MYFKRNLLGNVSVIIKSKHVLFAYAILNKRKEDENDERFFVVFI